MSEVHTITGERLRAAYDALGLDPELYNSTAEIVITPHKVEVTRYHRDSEGMVYDPATDGPLTVVTELRLRYESESALPPDVATSALPGSRAPEASAGSQPPPTSG